MKKNVPHYSDNHELFIKLALLNISGLISTLPHTIIQCNNIYVDSMKNIINIYKALSLSLYIGPKEPDEHPSKDLGSTYFGI